MNQKIKNVILFFGIAIVMIVLYVVFIKKDKEEPNLVSTSADLNTSFTNTLDAGVEVASGVKNEITDNFLSLLLNVKGITLDDKIFSDVAFMGLKDSSILLSQDGTEGRINPFAPIGTEVNNSLQNLTKPQGSESLPTSTEVGTQTNTTNNTSANSTLNTSTSSNVNNTGSSKPAQN